MDKSASDEQPSTDIRDHITQEEQTLAEELRGLCTIFGEEKPENVTKCAAIFLKLGELYLEKAKSSEGMPKRLSFIRSCALLNGARVRLEKLADNTLLIESSRMLEDFSRTLFEACGVESNCSIPFLSKEFHKKLLKLRKEAENQLLKVRAVQDASDNEASVSQERDKIYDIKRINIKTTEAYQTLIQNISEKCFKLLGNPPCQFAQVGLGSMARQEITLYSDFEHVIVLEEGFNSRDDSSEILEYFRWFSVLLESIVIGFGETVIRSVGVKSINDAYSPDKSKNWFYDVNTPSGFAFDGMVPHASMNPLGRQDFTKTRRHVVEFIQPVSKMASFLSSDEHVKNGYYIKDILGRTCFLYGSREVYDHFKSKSAVILNSERMCNIARDEARKIDDNMNIHLRHRIDLRDMENINAKITFYRPLTALLAYVARLHAIYAPSSLDIITELEKNRAITQTQAHNLKFAVAVACEIRLKANTTDGQQRYELNYKDVERMVSSKTLYRCREMITFLYSAVKTTATFADHTPASGKSMSVSSEVNQGLQRAQELVSQRKFSEAVSVCLDTTDDVNSPRDTFRLRYLLASSYFELGMDSPDQKRAMWENALVEYHCLLSMTSFPDVIRATFYCNICDIYEYQGCNEEALGMCHEWYELYSNDKEMADSYRYSLPDHLEQEIRIRRPQMEPKDLIEYLRAKLIDEKDLDAEFMVRHEIAKSEIEIGLVEKPKTDLVDLVREICLYARQLRDPKVWLQNILITQRENGWFRDANTTIDLLFDFPFIFSTSYDGGIMSKHDLNAFKLSCLANLNLFEDGMDYFEKMSEKSQKSYSDFWSIFTMNLAVLQETDCGLWSVFMRGIKMCKKHPDVACYTELYAITIFGLIKKLGPRFLNDGAKIFCEAPLEVRNHEKLRGHVTKEISTNLLISYITPTEETPSDKLEVVLKGFQSELLHLNHAHGYCSLGKLIKLHEDIDIECLGQNLDLFTRMFDLGVLSKEEYASLLWKIINVSKLDRRDRAVAFMVKILPPCDESLGIFSLAPCDLDEVILQDELMLRKQIAEMQLENEEAGKARKSFSRLVHLVQRFGVEMQASRTLLKNIMLIQRRNGWPEDALSTIDIIQAFPMTEREDNKNDVMCDGFKLDLLLHLEKYCMGIKHIEGLNQESTETFATTIAFFYAIAGMKSGDDNEIICLIRKSMDFGRKYTNSSEFAELCTRNLIFLFTETGPGHFKEVADMFSLSPGNVQNAGEITPSMIKFVANYLDKLLAQIAAGNQGIENLSDFLSTPLLEAARSDEMVARKLENLLQLQGEAAKQ